MKELLRIEAPTSPLQGEVTLPASKSIANRALVCAALAGNVALVRDAGEADDTVLLRAGLASSSHVIDCGLGGTTLRFLLAWASVQEGREFHLSADPALLRRPHEDLVDALRSIGADVQQVTTGFRVRGRRLPGGEVTLHAPVSSQFISALMLVGHRMQRGIRILWTGQRLSEPYVHMTARVLGAFGLDVTMSGDTIFIPPGCPSLRSFVVPPDWSAAAFWAEAVALVPGSDLLLKGLLRDGWQGDEALVQHWAPFVGTEDGPSGIRMVHRSAPAHQDVDLSATPDLFPALAVTYAARGVQMRFTGLHNMALKESDRLTTIANLLQKGGVRVKVEGFSMTIDGQWQCPIGLAIDPAGDHRIAMAAAPLAIICRKLNVIDASVVRKSYPDFWEQLGCVGFGITHLSDGHPVH